MRDGEVVALVNRKSGGHRVADYVYNKLMAELGEERVFLLFDGPDASQYATRARNFLVNRQADVVIVAGGDGTLSFGMDVIKDLHDRRMLDSAKGVVAPFPLGTGNDLSYTLGYGGGFARWVVLGGLRFRNMMHLFRHSKVVQLDRWHLRIARSWSPPLRKLSQTPSRTLLAQKVMNNYFSVGFDAAIAERLNAFRQRHPKYFFSRPIVKLWYAYFAAMALLTEKPLGDTVTVYLDGRALSFPASTKALVVANMITYAGGSILWGPNKETERTLYGPPSLTDAKVEVAALSGIWHLAFVRMGLCYATKLGQGEHVEVISAASNHHQYDGEPLVFPEQCSEPAAKGEGPMSFHFEIRYFCNSDVLQAHLPRRHLLSKCLTALFIAVAIALLPYRFFLA